MQNTRGTVDILYFIFKVKKASNFYILTYLWNNN